MVGDGRGRPPVATEVVGFRGGRTLLMPLGELHGIGPGTLVNPTGEPFRVAVGESLLGRVIDGLGNAARRAATRRTASSWRVDHRRAPGRAEPPADPRPRRPRRPRARRADPLRPRPAPRHLRRLRRRQVVAARHDRPLDDRRGQRDRTRRRARPRGPGVHRARPRRRARATRSSSSRPPTSLRWSGSAPPSRPPRSPSTSATRAAT